MSFVHLHCHSEYSLLDGANRIDDLIDRALELEQPALAITDHGNLHAAWAFQERAKKAGIKPEQFVATAKSFSVDANCRRADQLVKSYKITGTPSLVINGHYLVNMGGVKSENELIELVSWLVAKEAG